MFHFILKPLTNLLLGIYIRKYPFPLFQRPSKRYHLKEVHTRSFLNSFTLCGSRKIPKSNVSKMPHDTAPGLNKKFLSVRKKVSKDRCFIFWFLLSYENKTFNKYLKILNIAFCHNLRVKSRNSALVYLKNKYKNWLEVKPDIRIKLSTFFFKPEEFC